MKKALLIILSLSILVGCTKKPIEGTTGKVDTLRIDSAKKDTTSTSKKGNDSKIYRIDTNRSK